MCVNSVSRSLLFTLECGAAKTAGIELRASQESQRQAKAASAKIHESSGEEHIVIRISDRISGL